MTESIPMELLAPAGNAVCALAAFNAGADAIYAGLPKFNARERGENFTADELARTIAYAHGRGKKVYLALNTIVKETELPELVEYLGVVSDLAPDAVIVQDLGVLRIIREYFPNLTIHASTQMGLHNSAGLEIARALGVKRVILERQVTLDELAEMRRKSDMEIEIFGHGALCCSLSGECLFSSWYGGASGNRGKCKQPCRRRFYSKNGNGFFFSTADLETLEMIGEFRKLGISSLKIEGRLKQCDYVYNAVKAYRTVMDAPTIDRTVLGEARKILSESCGRRWSEGFYRESSLATLVQHHALGASGTLLGRVGEVAENGFFFVPNKRLHVGDRIRVQSPNGDEGPAITVTKMFVANAAAKKASPGELCFICCDKSVARDGLIFKTGHTMEVSTAVLEKFAPRKQLNLELHLSGNALQVHLCNVDGATDFVYEWALAEADKRPAEATAIISEFRSGASELFAAGEIHVEIAGNWFLPGSVLKSARRAFWSHVDATVEPQSVQSVGATGMYLFQRDYLRYNTRGSAAELEARNSEFLQETIAMKPRGAEPGNPKAIRADFILDYNRSTQEVILPDFCAESRLDSLAKAIQRALADGVKRFRITALFQLSMLQDIPGITLVSSFPLPVANSMAALELSRFGVAKVQAAVELEKEAVEALRDHLSMPLELYRYGRVPLLTTRAKLPAEGDIRDNRGADFSIRFDSRSRLTRLYAKKVVSVPRLPGCSDFYDLTQAWWGEKETSEFNFTNGWL